MNSFLVKNRTAGFTYVEMIVVIALFTLLSLAVTNAIRSFYTFNAYTIAQAYQVAEARRGMQYSTRDIREMTFADDGAFPLVSMATNSISFYSDIDRDDSVELVRYELSSTTLFKYVSDAAGDPPTYSTSTPDETYTISIYVQNNIQGVDTFTYYDLNGDLATPSTLVTDIRYVGISLIINIDPVRDPGEFMLRSSASLRNLLESL